MVKVGYIDRQTVTAGTGITVELRADAGTATNRRTPCGEKVVSFFFLADGDGWCGVVGVYAFTPPPLDHPWWWIISCDTLRRYRHTLMVLLGAAVGLWAAVGLKLSLISCWFGDATLEEPLHI